MRVGLSIALKEEERYGNLEESLLRSLHDYGTGVLRSI